MKIYNSFHAYDSLFICGDIHGEFKTLLYELKRKDISNAIILVAGDCGIGFEKPAFYDQLYQKLTKTLQKINCLLLLIRGNHDDPEYFHENSWIDYPLLKTIPDYSVISFKNHNILCVGGAVSIDRSQRLQAMWLAKLNRRTVSYYWEDEMPIYNQASLSELKSHDILIDIVVTHTAPSFCMPITKTGIEGWLLKDNQLDEDTTKERLTIDKIYNQLTADNHPLSNWFYGHFHFSNTEYISGICFKMLDIMELYECRMNS